VTTPVAAFRGAADQPGRLSQAALGQLRSPLEQFRSLGIDMLVLAGDVYGTLAQEDLERVQVSLAQAAKLAAEHGVRLAFEFQGRASFANNLQTAAALVGEIGSRIWGSVLTFFTTTRVRARAKTLGYLSSENLFHVQLCDLAGVPREFANDADRILPGDGDFQLEPIVERFRQIAYGRSRFSGADEPADLADPATAVWRDRMTALRKVLGQASMD